MGGVVELYCLATTFGVVGRVWFGASYTGHPDYIVFIYIYLLNMMMMPVYAGAPWIPKFKGAGGDLKFNKWKEQIQSLLHVREFNEQQKVGIVLGALTDEAKREVCVLGDTDRDTVAKILKHLDTLYGDQVPVANLRSQFFSCIQIASESLRAYVLRLRELFCRLNKRNPDGPLDESHLLDQLLMGLRNAELRSTIRTYARRNPDATFNTVLEEIFLLEREQRPGAGHEIVAQAVGGSSVFKSVTGKEDWAETFRQELLQEVRGQMNALRQEMIRQLQPAAGEPMRCPQRPNQPPLRRRVQSYTPNTWAADGKPICRQCGRTGHIARFCRPPSESITDLN